MPKSARNYRIYSWNVNGIRAVHRKELFLPWIEKEQPDIFCLQETKAQEEQIPKKIRHIDGYEAHFCSADKKGYSGVAIYSKVPIKNVSRGLGIDQFDSEGRTIVAEFNDFVLFDVYFPNGKRSAERLKYKMDFYDAFLKHVEDLRKKGKRIVFCGDVNTAHKEIDLARPKANQKISGFLPEERAWIDRVIEFGYADSFRMFNDRPENYTWWDMQSRARDRNVGWRIDYFFVDKNVQKYTKKAAIHADIMGSDHCPVSIELEF